MIGYFETEGYVSMNKYFKSLAAIVLAAVLLFSTVTAMASPFSSVKKEPSYRYGVDVSKWNGKINYKTLKDNGIDFLFIRVGVYTKKGGILDVKFKENVKKAAECGMEFGVYVYSYVYKAADNVKCAKWVHSQLKKLGNYTKDRDTIPVAYDIEDEVQKSVLRTRKVSNSYMQKSVMKFCDTIADYGYIPVVYSFESFFDSYLSVKGFQQNGVKVWDAQWPYERNLNTSVKKRFKTGEYADVWQFSSSFTFNGKVLDTNVLYGDFYDYNNEDSALTIKNLKSSYAMESIDGAEIKPSIKVYDGDVKLKKNTDYKLYYFDNARCGKGKIKIVRLENGKYKETKTVHFIISPTGIHNIKTASDKTSISFSWTPCDGASNYEIYEYDPEWDEYDLIDTVSSSKYTDYFLEKGTQYKLAIRAVAKIDGKKYYGPYTYFKAKTQK